jgi:uncharacterized protein YggE
MSQAEKTRQEKPLRLSDKALEKALIDSARQAHRLAAAFGQKVPGIPVKTEPSQRKS